jgi:O-methyltransferase involved in polyketide biosynthesis
MAPDTSRISPTAHYTGYVWVHNGLSFPALATRAGRRWFRALRPIDWAYARATHRPSLEQLLVARHRALDHLLAGAIAAGQVAQVVEIAGGLSARGARFAVRYPELRYIEGDLPGMAARKRRALARAGLTRPRHRVVELNALADHGPDSLSAVAEAELVPGVGTAIVTEGLINYFDRATTEAMFARFARCLRALGGGVYLSDVVTAGDAAAQASVRAFMLILSSFARGEVFLHYESTAEASRALEAAGFGHAEVLHPAALAREVAIPGAAPDRHIVRILAARTDR